MDKNAILQALKELRERSPKRKFSQTVDLVINLKNINLNKPEEKVDIFLTLPYSRGKKNRVCALVDAALSKQAKDLFDTTILKDEFPKWAKDKTALKKLARGHDLFVAQANLMTQVAGTFGRILGPLGKMPNPKAGCVVPETANLKPLAERLNKLIKLATKNEPIIKAPIGTESALDEQITENALTIYNHLINELPQGKNNIRSILIKFTMGPVFKIGEGLKLKENKK